MSTPRCPPAFKPDLHDCCVRRVVWDLVRYAAASGDFNPVHFDHQSAVDSGFPGVLVHGLLMGSWLLQSVAALSSRPDPLASAKLRFRNPLRPGVTAVVESVMEDSSDGTRVARSTLTAGEVELGFGPYPTEAHVTA